MVNGRQASCHQRKLYQFILLAPGLHYGQQAFEGLKVFETVDKRIVAFRPEENAKRMKVSCERICIPELPMGLL